MKAESSDTTMLKWRQLLGLALTISFAASAVPNIALAQSGQSPSWEEFSSSADSNNASEKTSTKYGAETNATTSAEPKTDSNATTSAEPETDSTATTSAEPKTDSNATTSAEPKTDSTATTSAERKILTGAEKVDVSLPPEIDTNNDGKQISILPTALESAGPIIIDNDETVEVEETIKYEELPTDEGKTKVKTGARFPVVVSSQITSKTASKGDPLEARLKYDLKIGNRLVAKKGSLVNGHINYCLKARSAMHSLVSPERWYRNSGCLGIRFDEIVNEKGEHLPLSAVPAKQARIVKNKSEGRELGVNHDGQVTGPWSQQLRYKAVRIGLNAAMAPAGVFSFGAMPVALGVIGAVNPSFAFMKPVGQNVRHRRIKGFVWGALSGVPGSWLIEDTVVKGQEAVIKPGDEFLVEFQQEFTGEPASEATLIPGASSKVHGEVMPIKKGKTKK